MLSARGRLWQITVQNSRLTADVGATYVTDSRRSFCNLRDVSKTNGVALTTNIFTVTADFSQWFSACERCGVRNGCELWMRWVCALFVVFRVSREITSRFCCRGLGLNEGLQDIHKDSWFCVSLPVFFVFLCSVDTFVSMHTQLRRASTWIVCLQLCQVWIDSWLYFH